MHQPPVRREFCDVEQRTRCFRGGYPPRHILKLRRGTPASLLLCIKRLVSVGPKARTRVWNHWLYVDHYW